MCGDVDQEVDGGVTWGLIRCGNGRVGCGLWGGDMGMEGFLEAEEVITRFDEFVEQIVVRGSIGEKRIAS